MEAEMFVARLAVASVLFAGVTSAFDSAHAALQISSKQTTGGVCTPTQPKAVLNVTELTNMLASGNLVVNSGVAHDMEIDAGLSWTSRHRLTLKSVHDISFNKPVTVAGAGSLTITTGSGGDFRFFGKGHVEFWDTDSSLTINRRPYGLYKSLRELRHNIRGG